MKSNYWIKLYHEMNYDPKIGRLSDRLFRRAIQCFLFAGEVGDGGRLPPIDDMAYVMRCDMEHLETELFNLSENGIISIIDGVYYVTNFTKWQRARTATERQAMKRSKKRKNEHNVLHDSHKDVTICDTEEEIESEEEKEEESDNNKKVRQFMQISGPLNRDQVLEVDELFLTYEDEDVLDCARWIFQRKREKGNTAITAMWTALRNGWNRNSNRNQQPQQSTVDLSQYTPG
jgi:hypothetical protein